MLFLFVSGMSSGEVTLDGTLGPKGSLSGPNYQIPANLGRRAGSNLFHSFGLFNVYTGESATFTGPDSIENILGRVTGGSVSTIDGLLRSTIPGADLYLFNPAGLIFGENARLDVQGSFHASTADYIGLTDGIDFIAVPSADDALLTTALPEAFGFLAENPAGISVEGSQLAVPTEQTLSLVGGDVSVRGGVLAALAGRINIASANAPGEVIMTEVGLQTDSIASAGDITISDSSVLIVDGNRAGQVVIRGGQFVLENRSIIRAATGEEPGLGIDIEVGQLIVQGDSAIGNVTMGTGKAGPLLIQTDKAEITNGGQIFSISIGNGDGGNIFIIADESLRITGSTSAIGANTQGGRGEGGSVTVTTPLLEIREGGIVSQSTCSECGDGGTIKIEAEQIRLLDGGQISAGSGGMGNGGNVMVSASESIEIAGSKTVAQGDSQGNVGSLISAVTQGINGPSGRGGAIEVYTPVLNIAFGGITTASACENCGDAGDVQVKVDQLQIREGGFISASTRGNGNAGDITIGATDSISISGIDSLGFPSRITSNTQGGIGEGGSLVINAPSLSLQDGSLIGTNSICETCGIAGDITLLVDELRLENSAVSTNTVLAGGGSIDIQAQDLVSLSNGDITTSVAGGDEDAGNITIDPVFVILQDQSNIIANAHGGAGGNIRISIIEGGAFFQSADSIVAASSNQGIDGSVDIDAPDSDIISSLKTLPAGLFDATHLLSTPCAYRSGAEISQFVVKQFEALPHSPYALGVRLPQSIAVRSDTDSARLAPGPRVRSPDAATGILKQSKPLASAVPSSAPIDEHLIAAATFYRMGQVRQGLIALDAARVLAERSNDQARLALAVGGISDGYLLTRRLDDAERYAKHSVSIARQSKNLGVLASSLNYYGNVLSAKQAYSKALKAYNRGIALAEQSSDAPLAAVMRINQLRTVSETRRPDTAKAQLSPAIDQIQALPMSIEKGYGLIALGDIAQQLITKMPANRSDLTHVAHTLFTDAQTVAETFNDPRIKSYTFGHLGELYALQGLYQDAEPFFRRAVFFAEESGSSEVAARWYGKLGELLYQRGRRSAAIQAYKNAIDNFEPIESALLFGRRGQPQLFTETIGDVYRQLAEITLKETEVENQPTEREGALRSVRGVMERFKVAELRNHFQDECINAQLERAQPKAIDAQLDPHTATLYPIMFPNHLSLLLSFDDGSMQSVRVPVKAVELKQALINFRKLLNRKGDLRTLRRRGNALYQWLIAPIDPFLKQHAIGTLIVVPDGALSTIPFAALYDGQDYLANRYALALSPGLTMTDVQAGSPKAHLTLLAGLTESVQGYSDLPYVSDEMKSVASLYEGKLLLDEAFQKDTVQTELKRAPYSVINFATHAKIDRDPKQSFLLTYNDKITFDELENFIRIGQFREQPLDLLVLSACSTAEGDERAALGLAGVALKAGARSAIGSLWNVNDASTAKLIPAVFEHLKKPGMTKARALQRAQQQLLTTPEYQHPYYWAPFVLIGSWL